MRHIGTFVVYGVCLLVACSEHIPHLAQGLPRTFGPTSDFPARVRERFPLGSGEDILISELRSEDFEISDIDNAADQYRHSA
jgi:hypothetical protein